MKISANCDQKISVHDCAFFRFSFEATNEMTGSPELSMVLEKAIVLLNGKEFSALRRILAEYEATEIDIDTFAESLLQLINDQEKVGKNT